MVFEKPLFDYPGAFHIHSKYSFDGNAEIADIVKSAKKNCLKFIAVTDHFNLDALKESRESYKEGVLVITGEEISPRHNHYLAFDIKEPVTADLNETKPQTYINKVNEQGGFGFIAHPDHTGTKKFAIKDYSWLDWSVSGYTGISIWDLMTDWQETLTSLPKALISYIFPAWMLKGPKAVTLKRWDELNQVKRIAGYGEIDNHNSLKKYFGLVFRIFPFDYAFSTIKTHVVLHEKLDNDYTYAKNQVFDAIKAFKIYIAQERWNNPEGFEFSVNNGYEKQYFGGEIKLEEKECVLQTAAPVKGKVRVIKNGTLIKEETTKKLEIQITEKGAYRIEVRQKVLGIYKPWIYSNPIWVI